MPAMPAMPATPAIPDRDLRGAALIVLTVAIVAACVMVVRHERSPFFTGYATEEPTRDYIPYTGTIPYGTWGVTPWALV